MEELNPIDIIYFNAGYFNTDKLAYPEGACAEGSENVFISGANSQRTFRGLKFYNAGGRTMFNVANGFASLNDVGSTQGIGSVFNYISESLFFIGEGEVFYNGTVLTDVNTLANFVASSSLQLSPKITGNTYEAAYTAGLAVPSAPQIVARTPVAMDTSTGLMTGLYSAKIARVRSVTGGRSIASPTSAVITVTDQSIRLTFPIADSNGQDRWAVFFTKAGFGGVGVHYLLMEIAETDLTTIDGVPRSFEFDFKDSDLLPVTAYIDDYPPPAASFAGRLDNYVMVFGAYDNAVAISIRNFPESFHPEHLGFFPSRPTAVLADTLGSYIYVSTEKSVHAVSVAPNAFDNPLLIQTVWSDTGVKHHYNWCSYEGAVFAFIARQGAVTTDEYGKPNNDFALPVAREMRDWSVDETSVFACPDLNGVIYINNGRALLFNMQNHKWSTPAVFDSFVPNFDSVVSGLVIDRRLKISTLDSGGNFDLYEFDEQDGATAVDYKLVSPDKILNPGARINLLGLKASFAAPESADYTFSVFCDYAATASNSLVHAGTVGMNTTKRTRWYLPRKEAVRIEFDGTQSDFTKDAFLSNVILYGTLESSNAI